jgi:hypothetical protein
MNVRISAIFLASIAMLHGCAVTPPGGGGSQNPGPPGDANLAQVCSPLVVGVAAAAACGLVAKGDNRVRASALCAAAAVAVCYLANSYSAAQTRSAAQVEADYLKNNRTLPAKPTVTAYRASVQPTGAVSRGQEVKVTSQIVAVPGRTEKNVLVEEELRIVDAQGETWGKPVRKAANTAGQAGEFQTSFTIPIRDGWSPGIYTLQRTLYLNGVATGRPDSSARFQVV